MSPLRLRRLDTRDADFDAALQRLRHWSDDTDAGIEQRVAAILADVRARGDAAVLEYTARLDGVHADAVAAAGGDVYLVGACARHLDTLVDKLRDAGITIDCGDDAIRVRADGRPRAVGFRTGEYPAFPTDMQAQLMAVDCIAEGTARIAETIFENRFMHVDELLRLGAHIEVDGHTAVVTGVNALSGANVMATDLRASASLVIAGLVAQGDTVVDRIYHLDRGYERMEHKLRAIGADIQRIRG